MRVPGEHPDLPARPVAVEASHSLTDWLEAAHAALGRRSRARVAVMEAIAAQAGTFSRDTLRATHPASRATIFRVLRALLDRNLLCEVPAIDGGGAYRISLGDAHHHLICFECGAVADANLGDLNVSLADAARALGFTPLSHRVDVFGRCAECSLLPGPGGGTPR